MDQKKKTSLILVGISLLVIAGVLAYDSTLENGQDAGGPPSFSPAERYICDHGRSLFLGFRTTGGTDYADIAFNATERATLLKDNATGRYADGSGMITLHGTGATWEIRQAEMPVYTNCRRLLAR